MRYTSRALFVSSWHLNAGESAAMWDLYLGTEPGVAIQSTVGALRQQMDAGSGATEVFIGAVEYIDYATDSWGAFRAFNRVFHKRNSFEHEREIRAVIVRPRYAELADLDLEESTTRLATASTSPSWSTALWTACGCRRGQISGSRRSSNGSWASSTSTSRSSARGSTTRPSTSGALGRAVAQLRAEDPRVDAVPGRAGRHRDDVRPRPRDDRHGR